MTAVVIHRLRAAAPQRQAQFRYGVVFLIVLTLLAFEIVAPDTDWARAATVALTSGALTVSVATSRVPGAVRRHRAVAVAGIALVVVVGVATGLFSATLAFAVDMVVVVSIPFTLAEGLMRLIKEEGVTVHAVAGALAIYLLVGLLFASVIAFAVQVSSTPYFKQANVSHGDQVYYSFTALTTTGCGDYTAATPVGHALAVLEMLSGQLYLVTVIAVLVGNFAGGAKVTLPLRVRGLVAGTTGTAAMTLSYGAERRMRPRGRGPLNYDASLVPGKIVASFVGLRQAHGSRRHRLRPLLRAVALRSACGIKLFAIGSPSLRLRRSSAGC